MAKASDLLIEARRRAGLTQAELARRAGVTRSVLNTYERGRREPGAETLNAILLAAGFELSLKPVIDLERNARILSDVLGLAWSLPYKVRPTLAYPPFKRRSA